MAPTALLVNGDPSPRWSCQSGSQIKFHTESRRQNSKADPPFTKIKRDWALSYEGMNMNHVSSRLRAPGMLDREKSATEDELQTYMQSRGINISYRIARGHNFQCAHTRKHAHAHSTGGCSIKYILKRKTHSLVLTYVITNTHLNT